MKPTQSFRTIAKAGICAGAMLILTPGAQAATATGTFDVRVQILSTCSVTAGAGSTIDFGSVLSTASGTALEKSSAISVSCTKGTPYFIGLKPSDGSAAGLGEMAPLTGENPDKVPYQLRSTAGASGAIWGNTATTGTVGNGVAGTGTGATQSHTVYATLASANYTADTYKDTVTVTVNY